MIASAKPVNGLFLVSLDFTSFPSAIACNVAPASEIIQKVFREGVFEALGFGLHDGQLNGIPVLLVNGKIGLERPALYVAAPLGADDDAQQIGLSCS
ncbi:hypothetical protein [Pseudomonas sp. LF090]